MIPNEGNTSSYLLVLICDLTRTILTEFENIVSQPGHCEMTWQVHCGSNYSSLAVWAKTYSLWLNLSLH
jgi:hypothetical protein